MNVRLISKILLMKLKYPFFVCLLIALALPAARAGIVIDEAPQQQQPPPVIITGPGRVQIVGQSISVPAPKDTAPAPAKSAGPVSDTMRFINNDSLHGSFLGYEKGGNIRWQSPESKDPIVFQATNLTDIKLDSHKPPANATPPTHAILLTNNDELPGTLTSMDDKVLTLDTWYAGKLLIPRAMVKSITPLKTSLNILYQGPTSMDGWVLGPRFNNATAWAYRDGSLICTNYGMISREVKLAGLASVDLDVVYRGNSQISVALYSDRTDNMSNCYMFQFNGSYISLQRMSQNGGNNFGDNVQLPPNTMMHDKMHIGIRVNKELKSFWLYVNGNMVKQWTDPAEFAGKGSTIMFMSQQQSYTKISNIKVSTWDGELEGNHSAAAKAKEDTIKMENQDKVSGKLKSIENGKAIFTSSYADLTVPMDRIEEISMSGEGADQAKRNAGDIKAWFAERGSITMQLESWDDKQATATSPNFGKASFSPNAFQRLQFNLNRAPASSDSTDVPGLDTTSVDE